MTRADRRTLVRQLDGQGLSRRAIAKRLGVGKDTVRRDLAETERQAEPETAPPAAPDEPHAPQVSTADEPESAPGGAPQAAPDADASAAGPAHAAPPPGLPRRVAQPLSGVDLSQWPALRRDLAVLAQTGRTPEGLVHQAVVAMAHAYRQALARGDIEPGQEFLIASMDLRPRTVAAVRPAGV